MEICQGATPTHEGHLSHSPEYAGPARAWNHLPYRSAMAVDGVGGRGDAKVRTHSSIYALCIPSLKHISDGIRFLGFIVLVPRSLQCV